MKRKDQELLEEAYQQVLQGATKEVSIEDVCKKHNIQDTSVIQKELEKGIKIEHEHTKDENIAKKIALDHLMEHPEYYTKLAKVGL